MPLGLSGSGLITGFDPTASGFGKVLQVVRATDTTDRSTSSTSYVDASISVTITPKKIDSAIIVMWFLSAESPSGNALTFLRITDSSNNALSGAQEASVYGSDAGVVRASVAVVGYSTPATTSPTTYKGRFSVSFNTGTLRNSGQTGQMYAIEVAA